MLCGSHGSCIIAIKGADGIVLGSDTQSSSGGSMIGNRETNKIFSLNEYTVLCCAAGVRNVHKIKLDLMHQIRIHKLYYGNDLSVSSIARLSRLFIHNKYKNAHIIIAGIESDKSSKIFEITPSGSLFEHDYVVAGTSSTSLYPLLEQFCEECNPQNNDSSNALYSKDNDKVDPFTRKKAIKKVIQTPTKLISKHVKKLLRTATKLDPMTGGKLCTWLLTSDAKHSPRFMELKM